MGDLVSGRFGLDCQAAHAPVAPDTSGFIGVVSQHEGLGRRSLNRVVAVSHATWRSGATQEVRNLSLVHKGG